MAKIERIKRISSLPKFSRLLKALTVELSIFKYRWNLQPTDFDEIDRQMGERLQNDTQ